MFAFDGIVPASRSFSMISFPIVSSCFRYRALPPTPDFFHATFLWNLEIRFFIASRASFPTVPTAHFAATSWRVSGFFLFPVPLYHLPFLFVMLARETRLVFYAPSSKKRRCARARVLMPFFLAITVYIYLGVLMKKKNSWRKQCTAKNKKKKASSALSFGARCLLFKAKEEPVLLLED